MAVHLHTTYDAIELFLLLSLFLPTLTIFHVNFLTFMAENQKLVLKVTDSMVVALLAAVYAMKTYQKHICETSSGHLPESTHLHSIILNCLGSSSTTLFSTTTFRKRFPHLF